MVWERLGNLIENINERNTDLKVSLLLGVNLDKKFFPSIANIIGTDLSTYKIVRKGQFACKLMSVGRDGVLPLGFLEDYDEAIVSGAYYAFKVKDETIILPQYLMLCMSRKEFDRELWFRSGGDVRGGTSWEELCSIKIPVPTLEEQQQIVNSYKSIEERIKLKKQINDNLESQIQSVFEGFFSDCSISDSTKLGDYVECVLGGTPSRDNLDYWNGNIAWINSGKVNDFRITTASEFISTLGLSKSATKLMPKHTVVLAITGATLGQESILLIDSCANQSVVGILENQSVPYEFIHPFIKMVMKELLRNQTGGAQPHINKDDVNSIPLAIPKQHELASYVRFVKPFYDLIENNAFELDRLNDLQANLLALLSR